jgi:type II secretory pathway predicted ATPase ExeA
MYEKHFGLKTKPFGSNAEGPAVFVGPQQTDVINSLKKGLNTVDSVVTVSGPVGVGKTTLVTRALEATSPGRMVAWVGRMSLAPDEVLELLLTGFGISRQATGTVQRVAAFQRLLGERATAGAQVAIAVEDAQRVGVDALVELESLTAADSGDATGANIILMGQPELNEWLATPALARLRQRMRLRQSVEPFSAPEVLGYLRHSIRNAGGDFEKIFDAGAVDMLHRCSEGIPRVINNLCASALTTAADEGSGPLTAQFIQKIAKDMLGIDVFVPASPATSIVAALSTPEPTPAPDPKQAPQPATSPKMPEPANSAAPDIESTQTLKKPQWKDDQIDDAGVNNDGEIPGELTFEVEQTARMKAINADKIVQAEKEGKNTAEDPEPAFKAAPLIRVDKDTPVGKHPAEAVQAAPEPKPGQGPSDDDLPMLSQSMRITAPTPAPPEAMPKPVAPAKPATKPKPPVNAKAAPKPQATAKAAPKPIPQAPATAKAAPTPKPQVPATAKAAPKPKAPAPAPKAKPKAPVEEKPALKPKPATPAEAKVAPKLKAPAQGKAKPKAAPQAKAAAKTEAKAPQAAKPKPKADPNAATGEKPRMPDIDSLEAAIEAAHNEAAVEAGPEPADDSAPAVSDVTLSDIPALSLELEATRNEAPSEPVAKPAPKPAAKPAPAPSEDRDKGPDGTEPTLTGVPALTLDETLEEKRAEAAKLDPKLAQKIGEAESIKDFTDTMAETLFGDSEFEAIAADVVANPPPGKTAPGKAAAAKPADDVSPVMLDPELQPEPEKASNPAAPPAKPKQESEKVDLEMSMSRRMDMVKELNKIKGLDKADAKTEKIEMGKTLPGAKMPKPDQSLPESIEDQMTATLQTLGAADAPPLPLEEDEPKDKKSGGLLSRFKRSS